MTTKEVKNLIKKYNKTWTEFLEFMNGQTIGGTPNNPDWYECDVNRFVNNLKVID